MQQDGTAEQKRRKEGKRGRNQIPKNLNNFHSFFLPLLTGCQITENKWETAGNLKNNFQEFDLKNDPTQENTEETAHLAD